MAGAGATPPFVAAGAVIDLDGTLLDTEPIYYTAYAAVAAAHGHAYSFEAVHVHLLGRAEHEGAATLVRLLGLPLTPQQLLEQRDAHLLPGFARTRPLPGALAAMRALKAAGLRMAIATSSCRAYLELKKIGNEELFSLFDAIVCGDDARVAGRSKSDPTIFLEGARVLGVPPSSCLAVEDSLAGVAAAVAAGMRVVCVPDPRLSAGEVAQCGAHVTLASLSELCVERHAGVVAAAAGTRGGALSVEAVEG
jgi:pseudouridine-5'-monophosphatase